MMGILNPHGYDAILLVSFGGPEGKADVIPFLENVLHGRNVPHERMLEVAEQYMHFNGVSPINAQNRALIDALKATIKVSGPDLPIYWGNRNWHPFLRDTMKQMADDGIKHALAIFTSLYSSYSGCRQYRDNIAEAQALVGEKAPQVTKIRHFFNHPSFIEPTVELVRAAIEQLPVKRRQSARLIFSAHSLPQEMAANCSYELQVREASRLVASAMGKAEWSQVYQSRSGPPHQLWLSPDICDELRALHTNGVTDVVVVPIGFLSDHMEVLFDLDTQAKAVATELGMNFVRAATVGTHPTFISGLRDLIIERMTNAADKPALGVLGPCPDICPQNCCLEPANGQRAVMDGKK